MTVGSTPFFFLKVSIGRFYLNFLCSPSLSKTYRPMTYPDAPSPAYILEENRLRRNLTLIKSIAERAGVEFILAFKAYALWKTFPIFREYISHTTASSPYEARLALEEFGSRAHTYTPAYEEETFPEILRCSEVVPGTSAMAIRSRWTVDCASILSIPKSKPHSTIPVHPALALDFYLTKCRKYSPRAYVVFTFTATARAAVMRWSIRWNTWRLNSGAGSISSNGSISVEDIW